jgi:hypothetical protein
MRKVRADALKLKEAQKQDRNTPSKEESNHTAPEQPVHEKIVKMNFTKYERIEENYVGMKD